MCQNTLLSHFFALPKTTSATVDRFVMDGVGEEGSFGCLLRRNHGHVAWNNWVYWLWIRRRGAATAEGENKMKETTEWHFIRRKDPAGRLSLSKCWWWRKFNKNVNGGKNYSNLFTPPQPARHIKGEAAASAADHHHQDTMRWCRNHSFRLLPVNATTFLFVLSFLWLDNDKKVLKRTHYWGSRINHSGFMGNRLTIHFWRLFGNWDYQPETPSWNGFTAWTSYK